MKTTTVLWYLSMFLRRINISLSYVINILFMKRSAIVWTAIFKKYIRYIMVVSQCYRRVRILEYPGEIADRASRWRSLSYCRDGSLEKMVLQHFQYIGKSTVIWQSVSKFPICFRYIQHMFLFILGIYWSFSVFFQKYVIKCFTRLNTISVFFLQIVLCWTQSQTEAFYYFEWGASIISGGNLKTAIVKHACICNLTGRITICIQYII